MSTRVHCRLTRLSNIILVLFVICGLGRDGAQAQGPLPESQAANRYFTIRVVDRQTQRGIPLVELRTVNSIRYCTDSQGIIAFDEPGLMNRDVFFFVESHGYTFPKDGFGMQGRRLKTRPGHTEVLEVDRLNLAERLYRITGQGVYRDSLLVGLPVPVKYPALNGQVMGQDSVFTCLYQGRLFWFWGDTNRPSYPLGNFAMSGAVSALPEHGGLDPEIGVDLTYFVDDKGFSRPVAPMKDRGLIWLDGIMTVPDQNARMRMLARFTRLKSLTEVLERGLMVFNDQTQRFEVIVRSGLDFLPFSNTGHAFPVSIEEQRYYYFTSPSPVGVRMRVQALYGQATDPNGYEILTMLRSTEADESASEPYCWRRFGDLLNETKLSKAALIQTLEKEVTDLNVHDIETGKAVVPHNGTVYYNTYRERWIAIFCQRFGDSSALGEIWFAEADTPTGPWGYARKIVTHNKYSFYNPKHHPLFDKDQGRRIFFEGTYTHTFSGTLAAATPRYDYNQIMYGLDLADPRLCLPVPVYRLENGAYLLGDDVNEAGQWDEVESIPFHAMAPERAADDLQAVFALNSNVNGKHSTRLTTERPDPETPALFYALETVSPAEDSDMLVSLYEYRNPSTDRYAYLADPQGLQADWKRNREPLCRVWKAPARPMVASNKPCVLGTPTD
jgi:hypothetical protein